MHTFALTVKLVIAISSCLLNDNQTQIMDLENVLDFFSGSQIYILFKQHQRKTTSPGPKQIQYQF